MNMYLQTLLDPWGVQGIRIPDNCVSESATFVVDQTVSARVNANGVAMVCAGASTTAARAGSLLPARPNYEAGCVSGSTTTEASVFFGTTAYEFPGWTFAAGVPQAYAGIRLVSACMTFEVSGAINTAAGQMIATFIPQRWLDLHRGGSAVPWQYVQRYPGAVAIPINKGKTLTTYYRPVDKTGFVYVNAETDVSTSESITKMSFFPGVFICVVQGATPGLQLVGRVHLNYEGIPNFTVGTPETAISVADPISMSNAMQAAEMDLGVMIGGERVVPPMNGPKDKGESVRAMEAKRNIAEVASTTVLEKLVSNPEDWDKGGMTGDTAEMVGAFTDLGV